MNEAILSLLDVVPTILKLEDQTVLHVLLPVLSFRAPKAENTVPLYVMFQLFRYRDWHHPNKLFSPPKCLITLYPSVVDFVQKWPIPCVYSLVSHPNKTTTFLMEDKEYCSHWQFSRIQNVWEQMALNFATVCCRLPGLSPTWVFCPFTYVRCSRTWIKMDAVSLDLLSRPLSRMLLVARAHIFLLKRNLRNRLQKLFSRLVRKCPLLISPLLCTLSRPPNLAPRPPARSGAQTSRLSHKGMPLSYNRVLVNICGHLESLPIRLGTEGGIPVVQTSLFAPPPPILTWPTVPVAG